MGAFPASFTAGYDWTAVSNLNMFTAACRNRNYMITNGNYGTIATVSAGADVSAASWIRSLQSWVEINYQYFCRMNVANPNQPGSAKGNDTRAGLKYNSSECGSTATAATYFSTDAGLNVSSTPANWWRRKAPGVDSFGAIVAGDYIGTWIWQDLAKALRALRLFRMTSDPIWYPVKLEWLEVARQQLPPNPPGMLDVAKGSGWSSGNNPPPFDYGQNIANNQYRTGLTGNSYVMDTQYPNMKIGNFAYETYLYTKQPFRNPVYTYKANLMSLFAQVNFSTTARWPTGAGDIIVYVNALLDVTIGRNLWGDPNVLIESNTQMATSQYLRFPPSNRGGAAPAGMTAMVSGWNACWRKTATNLNTSGVAYECNLIDPLPVGFTEWWVHNWSVNNFPAGDGNWWKEFMKGWMAKAADAYYLVEEY